MCTAKLCICTTKLCICTAKLCICTTKLCILLQNYVYVLQNVLSHGKILFCLLVGLDQFIIFHLEVAAQRDGVVIYFRLVYLQKRRLYRGFHKSKTN